MQTTDYDPFLRGPLPVGVRTVEAFDAARDRRFPCEIWYPAAAHHAGQDLEPETQDVVTLPSGDASRRQAAVRDAEAEPGSRPLVVYSHSSGRWNRRAATFLCTHLASHGYAVAALDHSEVVAPELTPRAGETAEQKRARVEGTGSSRVPDVRFLMDHLLDGSALGSEVRLDPNRIGAVGHSFGGWTVLAATEADARIRAVVALAPGGASQPKPGILPLQLTFDWGRDVSALYLTGESDVMTPLPGIVELFERTPAPKCLVVLRRADHLHFMDDAAQEHETARAMPWPGDLAWIAEEMQPIANLCSEEEAHTFTRGLALGHMDAALREIEDAQTFMRGDLTAELAARGVDAFVHT